MQKRIDCVNVPSGVVAMCIISPVAAHNYEYKRAMMALGRSPEYHWNQIISKSVHLFSSRSRLKLFSFYSPGGNFVQQSGTFEQFL